MGISRNDVSKPSNSPEQHERSISCRGISQETRQIGKSAVPYRVTSDSERYTSRHTAGTQCLSSASQHICPQFNTRTVYVNFLLCKMARRQVFLRVPWLLLIQYHSTLAPYSSSSVILRITIGIGLTKQSQRTRE
jgi:hypothetical protein